MNGRIYFVWSVLYEMATGRMAFHGNTAAIIYEAILKPSADPPTKTEP